MIVPCPLQWPQVLAIEKNPCWKRTCPEPRHCGHVFGMVPGLAPRPPHVSQLERRGTAVVFSEPQAPPPQGTPRAQPRALPPLAPGPPGVPARPEKSPDRPPEI